MLQIKPWPSRGSEAEVDLMQLQPLREPIVMTLERPRAAFARPNINFVDKDAQEIHAMSASHMELRPYKDPAFELQRRLADRGAQAVPQQAHCGVQVRGSCVCAPHTGTMIHKALAAQVGTGRPP